MERKPTRLSSLWTIFYKFGFPIFWFGLFSFESFSSFRSEGGPADNSEIPIELKLIGFAFFLLVSAFIYWSCGRLKKVRMDSKFLYISNYFREIQVPLSLVERVTEWRWDNTHPVTIHFSRPIEFGSKITFMPKTRMFAFWSSHPVVDQILSAAAQGDRPQMSIYG